MGYLVFVTEAIEYISHRNMVRAIPDIVDGRKVEGYRDRPL
jgi:hypothetical protein